MHELTDIGACDLNLISKQELNPKNSFEELFETLEELVRPQQALIDGLLSNLPDENTSVRVDINLRRQDAEKPALFIERYLKHTKIGPATQRSRGIFSLVWCEITDPSFLRGSVDAIRTGYTTDVYHNLVKNEFSVTNEPPFRKQFMSDMISASRTLAGSIGSTLSITIHENPVPFGDSQKGDGGTVITYISDGKTWQPLPEPHAPQLR